MRKTFGLLIALFLVICSFELYKYVIVQKNIENYLDTKYAGKIFTVKDINFDIKKFIFSAQISCSDGISFSVKKRSNDINDNYLDTKYKFMITENIKEMLNKNELLKYTKNIDINILDNMKYVDISNDKDINYYLTVEFNKLIENNNEFAEITYRIINSIKNAKFRNIGTYLFIQDRNDKIYKLLMYPNEAFNSPKEIYDKIDIVVEEQKH